MRNFGMPTMDWTNKCAITDPNENSIDNCFVPIENILSHVIIAVDTLDKEQVLFVVPVVKHL